MIPLNRFPDPPPPWGISVRKVGPGPLVVEINAVNTLRPEQAMSIRSLNSPPLVLLAARYLVRHVQKEQS